MAHFTMKFNIGDIRRTSTWAAFRGFIESLRRELGVRFSHNLPVLRPEEDVPTQWVDIILQVDQNTATTFRVRGDNLYVVGYQGRNGQWLEFTDDDGNPQQLIPASTTLHFGGSYGALTNTGRIAFEDVQVSQINLIEAVQNLAITTNGWERARSLIVVILMISETTRFEHMLNFITTNYRTRSTLSPNLEGLVHGWINLSRRLLRADVNPYHLFRIPANNMGIENMEQAVNAMGILKDCSSGIRRARHAVAVAGAGQCGVGQPLAEVFSVTINNIDDENPGQLYGTIKVTDGLTSQFIYKRESSDYGSIIPGKTCTLTGPNRCISADDSFTIDLDLWDYDSFSPDDEVSHGQIMWNVFDDLTNRYDQLLVHKVDGKYGSSTVNYAVFGNAVQATVDITLIDGDGENPANVYGLLAAHNNRAGFANQIVLFKRESDNYIDVAPGAPIPLLRSAVVVSLESSLTVKADLYDKDSLSPDDEIANGSAVFTAQLSGTNTKDITGKYGKIQVKVTWIDT